MPFTLSADGSSGSAVDLRRYSYDTNGITFEMWIKTSTQAKQTLLLATSDSKGYPHIYLENDQIGICWDTERGPIDVLSTNNDPVSDGKWHHIAVVVSGPFIDIVHFYKDGQTLQQVDTLTIVTTPSEHQMKAGHAFNDAAAFSGEMTDIRLWNVARSSEEVAMFFQASLNPAVAGLVGYWPLSDGTATEMVYGGTAKLHGSYGITWDPDIVWTPVAELVSNVPSQPFPTFTGEQADAYAAIVGKVGGDLRSQYANLAFPVGEVKSTVDDLPVAPGIGPNAWAAVVSQLDTELTAVAAVQDYFAQVNAYLVALQVSNNNVLNEMIALVSAEGDAKVSGSFIGLIGSMLSALGIFTGGTTGVVGSILSAVASQSTQANSESSDQDFEVEQAQLWGVLEQNFVDLVTTNAQSETTLLSDWGKLEAALNFVDQNIMAWPPLATADAVEASKTASSISYLQMLIPTKWHLYQLVSDAIGGQKVDSPKDCSCLGHSVPDHAWSAVGGTAVVAADDDDVETFISSALHDELFDTLGVSKSDFFAAQGGWNLSLRVYHCCNGSPFPCNCGVQPG